MFWIFKMLYTFFWKPPHIAIPKKRIIIAKVNQIGDVTMSLPLASALKKADPSCTIIFLGRAYTKALIEAYRDVDEFANWDILKHQGLSTLGADIIINITQEKEVYQAGSAASIPIRIGTLRKWYAWSTCTHWVNFTRNGSSLHETQLDMKYLKPFGLQSDYSLHEIMALRQFKEIPCTSPFLKLLDSQRFNLILHPKTKGQHKEWPVNRFVELINILPSDKYNIFITGSAEEGAAMLQVLPVLSNVHNLTGKTGLNDLVELIAQADGLIAASTGPVHIAANLKKWTLGLYTKRQPHYAVRWGPIGPRAQTLTSELHCSYCQRNSMTVCICLERISAEEVFTAMATWSKDH